MPPSHAHFNGSVNLPDAETVMREIASRVPSGLRRGMGRADREEIPGLLDLHRAILDMS
jgi:hypothetical protein